MIISSHFALNRFYSRFAIGLVFLLIGITSIWAQTPLGISYQAIARSPDGLPLAEEPLDVKFRIHNGGASGPVEYAEQHNVETNKFGLFTLEIGKGTAISGTFESISWDTDRKFLEVAINNTLSNTSEMLSVPYALYAASAKEKQTLIISGNKLSITDGNEVTLPGGIGGVALVSDLNDVNTNGLQPGQVLKWNGTEWVPSEDETLPGQAAGDITGSYNALKVQGIQNQPVDPSTPTNGQVLQWNGTAWKPVTLTNVSALTAGTGIQINGNVISADDNSDTNEIQVLSLANGNELTLTNGGGTVTLPSSGNTLDALTDVNAPAPSSGQVLQWDGTAWKPVTLTSVSALTAGAGIQINGNVISADDNSDTNEIQVLSLANGNELTLTNGGGTVTLPSSGNISLDALTDVNAPAPSSGQVLQWDGTAWKPVTLTGGSALTAGAGIQINGNVVSADDNSATNEIQVLSLANGNELTLTNGGGTVVLPSFGNIPLDALTDVNAPSPSSGQVLQWDGTAWKPVTPTGGSALTAGAGIQINGNVVSADDNSATNEIQVLSLANGNELTLTNGGGTVVLPSSGNISLDALTDVNAPAPSSGQVLQWGGTAWEPVTPIGGSALTAGNGILINGSQIVNTGDTNSGDDLTTISSFSGDISGTVNNIAVNAIQGIPVSNSQPVQGQLLSFNNGQWEPVAVPAYTREIAIFEFRKAGVSGPVTAGYNRIPLHDGADTPNISLNGNTGANTITLQPGTYLIQGNSMAFAIGRHQVVFRNQSTGVAELLGTNEYSSSTGSYASTSSLLYGKLSVTVAVPYIMDHWVQYSSASDFSLGLEHNSIVNTPANTDNVYARIIIEKLQQ